jgi:DNA polymerase-4
LHVDLDAFYAAVAQRDQPALRGKPVLVGGPSRRGVVAAASYEARPFGVHSAMPMAEALRLCPRAIVVPHDWDAITRASATFLNILREFSPLVEGLSLDEAFVDITGTERLFGDPADVGRRIKARVRAETELVASVGVAPTKYAAKVASDIDKPDGLRVVTAEGLLAFLHPLPVSRLWGVGAKTRLKLESLGIKTIGDLAKMGAKILEKRLGPNLGHHLYELASGRDPREVIPDRAAVSMGHEETFEHDIGEPELLEPILLAQADRVAARLRHAGVVARAVVLKIKYGDFRIITRRRTLPAPTADGYLIGNVIRELLAGVPMGSSDKHESVRLCGVSATDLCDESGPRQLVLDEETNEKRARLGRALDSINDRYGDEFISRAITRRPHEVD